MKPSRFILFFVFFLIGSTVFSFSRRIETFVVQNDSSQPVVITRTFSDIGKNNNQWIRRWSQNICGVSLTITDNLIGLNEFRLLPGRSIEVVKFTPVTPRSEEIPFMNKIRGIFTSLRISTEDGATTITMDNLEEHIVIEVFPGETAFVVYIHD